MALKDNWVDRTNDEDFVLAEDINDVANAVIDLEDKIENGVGITVDAELSDTSENPVQNKVITQVVADSAEAMAQLGTAVETLEARALPLVEAADSGKMLQVVDGAWTLVAVADSSIKTYIDDYINEALGGDY